MHWRPARWRWRGGQRAAALGALAAAAAHELGTPLATISLTAKELLARVAGGQRRRPRTRACCTRQAERCRGILSDLAARPEHEGGAPFDRLSLTGPD